MFKLEKSLYTIALVILLLTGGCTKVDVETPQNNSVYITTPDSFDISWTNAPQDFEFRASLNGQDVSSFFAVTEEGATASQEDITPFLKHGSNQLFVQSPGLMLVKFYMDWQGPAIHVSAESQGEDLVVHGYLDDPSEIDSLTYSTEGRSQTNVALSNNQFSFTLPDTSHQDYLFTAIDSAGQKNQVTFSRRYNGPYSETRFNESLGLRLNMSGLDFVGAVAPDVVDQLAPLTLLKEANPVVNSNILGVIYKVYVLDGEFEISNLDIAPSTFPSMELDVDAELDIGYLTIQLCIQLQDLDLGIFGTIVFPVLCFEQADLSGLADLSAAIDVKTTDSGQLEVESFYPDVTLYDVDLSFTRIEDSFDSFIEAIVGSFLADLFSGIFDGIRSAIVNAVVQVLQFLNDVIAFIFKVDLISQLTIYFAEPAIQNILAQVPLSFDINLDLGDGQPKNVRATTLFKDIYRENTDLIVKLDSVLETYTPADVPDPFGVRNDGPAALPAALTPKGAMYDFSFALSTTFLNQVMDTAYHAGLFSLDVLLNTDAAEDHLYFYLGLQPQEDEVEAIIEVLPTSAPHFSVQYNGEANGHLILHDIGILVRTLDKQSDNLAYIDFLYTSINITIPFNLLVAEGNTNLALEIAGYADIEITEYQSEYLVLPSNIVRDLVNELESLIEPPILGVVNTVLSNVPLPSVLGLSLDPKEIWVDQNTSSIMIAGELVKTN